MIVRGKSELAILLTLSVGALALSQATLCSQEKSKLDRFGDPLPPGALARMGTVRMRHHTLIMSVALSPDGKTVASAGGWDDYNPNDCIRLWDLATGKEIRQLRGHTGQVCHIAFSPDGRTLASVADWAFQGEDNTVRIWDAATGKQLHVFVSDAERFAKDVARKTIAFSPDSKMVAFTDKGWVVRLWDIANGKELRRWNHPPGSNLVFTPDGRFIVSAKDRIIVVWEVSSGKQFRAIDSGRKNRINPEFFARDGKELVCTSGWNLVEREVVCVDWEKGSVGRVIPGALLGGSWDGRFVGVRGIGDGSVWDIHIWDLVQGKEVRRFPSGGSFASHSSVTNFTGALTNDGSTVVSADWNTIRVFETGTGQQSRADSGHTEQVVFVGFSLNDREVVSAGGDGVIRTWDVATARPVRHVKAHRSHIGSAAMTKDTRTLATAGWDGTVCLWDLVGGKETRRLKVGRGRPLVAFSPDEKTLAVKLNGEGKDDIQLWDLTGPKELRRFGSGNGGEGIAFLRDGKGLVDLSMDITVFDPTTGEQLRRFDRMPFHNFETSLALAPDRPIVATGNASEPKTALADPRDVAMWHVHTGTLITRFLGHEAGIASLAYSADGRLLASGSWDGTIRVWEALTGREVGAFKGHRGGVICLAFSHNGLLLASGGSDTSVLIWDLSSVRQPQKPSPVSLSGERLSTLWIQLRSRDGMVAWRAMAELGAARGEATKLFRERIFQKKLDEEGVRKLITLLDDGSFSVREKASRDLEDRLPEIAPILGKVLEGTVSTEARRRMTSLLRKDPVPEGELTEHERRALRLVYVLESMATDAGVRLLEELGKADTDGFLNREARAALERLRIWREQTR